MPIAILSAMEEEADSIVGAMTLAEQGVAGRRHWWRGTLGGHELVVAHSHWGKVAAASTATWLIASFDVEELLFTGVAGAIAPTLAVGDIVIGERLWQHDLDARPIIARHEVPLLGKAALESDTAARARLERAARGFVDAGLDHALPQEVRARFALKTPRVVSGGIASGDRFVHDPADAADIRSRLPEVLCVEMEGAAVAQVCTAFDVPFSICRTISDTADAGAPADFTAFVDEVARRYALGIVSGWLRERAPDGSTLPSAARSNEETA